MIDDPAHAARPAQSTDGADNPDANGQATGGLFSGLRIVSLLTLLSRVLGLVRDVGMAMLFGNGAVMDAFSVAFRVPNLARRFFGEGALTAAFLPVFVGEIEQNGKASAWKVGSAVLVLLGFSLCLFVLVAELALWAYSAWNPLSNEAALLIRLTAIMLPYLILICLSAQISAMLHALGHFTWPALVPVFLNIVWIAAIWWIAPRFETPAAQVTAVSGSIVLAGVIQMLAPWPALRRLGFRYDPRWRESKAKVNQIIRAMLPVLFGLSITQLNAIADGLIAWGFSAPESASLDELARYPMPSGTASALYLGQRMYQFPLGVFGVALGTVMFPLLSRHAQRGDIAELKRDFVLGLQLVVGIGLPASVGLVILAEPLTDLLFRRGAFDANDAEQTSRMIQTYGVGVWAYSALLIVHRGFYAIGDRSTPLKVGILAVVCNLILSFTLIWPMGGQGLALATALAAMLQIAAVTWAFEWRVGRLDWRSLWGTVLKAGTASTLMGVACWQTFQFLAQSAFSSRTINVAGPIGVSLIVYFAMAKLLNLKEFALLFRRERR